MSTEIANPWHPVSTPVVGLRVEPSPGVVAAGRAPRWLPGVAQILTRSQAVAMGLLRPRQQVFVLALVACLLGLIVPTEIAYEGEIWVSRRYFGIPHHVGITIAVVLLSLVIDFRYLAGLFMRPAVWLYLACLLMVVGVGFAKHSGNLFVVFADLYVIRWFFVGFLLMRLAIVSGNLRQYLLCAAVIILITAVGIDARNTGGRAIDTGLKRVSSNDLWPVMNLGTIMLGLLATVTWPQGLFSVLASSASLGLIILLGGIRTSTRSLFISQTLCLLLCLFALSRDPRMAGRVGSLRRVAVAAVLLGAATAIYMVATGRILGELTQLGSRFAVEIGTRKDTVGARFREASALLASLSSEEWFTGMGAGGMFFSPLGYWASIPHIGVLGWLQKGGVVVLMIALWTLYIRPAIGFFVATASPRQFGAIPPPIHVVGPPLLAWGALTFMSGGLDIGSSLGLGGLASLWMQLADDDRRWTAGLRWELTSSGS